MAKGKEVAKVSSNAGVQVYDDPYKDYRGPKGTDTIDAEDVSMPRLKLAQSMSKVVKDGLCKEGDLVHNITNEILVHVGERTTIVPICYTKQYILWKDINDGGGIFARANPVYVNMPGMDQPVRRYKWDKPHQKFENKIGGKQKVVWETAEYVDQNAIAQWGSEIPGVDDSGIAATAHHNYVVMLWDLPGRPFLAMSLARTAAKKARDLNAMLKYGNAPIFARKFQMASFVDKSDANEFYNYIFSPAGYVMPDDEMFPKLAELHEVLKQRGVNVDFSDNEADVGANSESEGGKKGKRF